MAREKECAHRQGTREWAFAEILKWLDDPASPQLFWLMGGGGTGKTVRTAELLDRVIHRAVAWHFCRHDNPTQSAPGSLLRSRAAMLAHRLPGYKEKLEATGVPTRGSGGRPIRALHGALRDAAASLEGPGARDAVARHPRRALTSCPRSRRSRCSPSSPASSLGCRRGSSSL